MGVGTSCKKMDCATVVEECSTKDLPKRPSTFWIHNCHNCGGDPIEGGATAPSSGSRDHEPAAVDLIATQDLQVKLVCDKFAIRRSDPDWRRSYILGKELGAGQTATVFEAFAAARNVEDGGPSAAGQRPAPPGGAARSGRRVALKRFFTANTSMFQQELRALMAVGVHPNIVRLLETFESGSNDDVLVLEHCDGSDVYELYAANQGCPMLETYVAKLIHQLLLALDHLTTRSVEHRDVKPENLLLYCSSTTKMAPCLKLTDFGWAVVVPQGAAPPKVSSAEGVGSLWYAPPELNPPVEGTDYASFMPKTLGKSDMWSAGVIAYLLLVGHSPFNYALRVADPADKEAEVIRLAALGKINLQARPWLSMSQEARSFILSLLQPVAEARPVPAEALRHPWLTGMLAAGAGSAGSEQPAPAAVPAKDRNARWKFLDGLQRLSWLAFARALAEPEMMEVKALNAFLSEESSSKSIYIERLAMELAHIATPAWFQPDSAWADILQLAFAYLDVDRDGMLSTADLLHHLVGEDAKDSADCWIFKWLRRQDPATRYATKGLSYTNFRLAMCSKDPVVQGVVTPAHAVKALSKTPNSDQDAFLADWVMEERMQALDGVCQRFLDEEFDENGYGL